MVCICYVVKRATVSLFQSVFQLSQIWVSVISPWNMSISFLSASSFYVPKGANGEADYVFIVCL